MLAMAIGGGWHLNDGEVERYSLGRSTGEELDRCDEHLLVCQPCREQVEETDVFQRAMRGAASQSPKLPAVSFGWLRFPRLIPVLAGFAVLVAVAWFGAQRLAPTPAAATILLTTSRGPGTQIQAPADTPLALRPDLTGLPSLPSYRLEVVDAAGARQWQGVYPGPAAPKMSAGVYFVRLYSPGGELYREFGLEIQKPR